MTGFIYVSEIDTNNIAQFSNVNELMSIQTRLSSQACYGEPDISMSVYTKDFNNLDNQSILIVVNSEGLSVEHSNVENVFNRLLENNDSLIKEIKNESHPTFICGVNLGSEITKTSLEKMSKLVSVTCTDANVSKMYELEILGVSVFPSATDTNEQLSSGVMHSLKIPEDKETDLESITPIITNAASQAVSDSADVIATIMFNKIKEALDKHLKESINKYVVEALKNIKIYDNKEKPKPEEVIVKEESVIEASAIEEVKAEKPIPVEPEIKKLEAKEELVKEDIIKPEQLDIKIDETSTIETNNKEISIYDSLNNLITEYDCENDNQLFNRILQTKTKLNSDDIENIVTFNMYEQIINDKTIKLSFSESKYRRSKLNL